MNDGKAGNQLKVAGVEGCNGAAEIQRGRANQWVFGCVAYATGSLLALDPASYLGRLMGASSNGAGGSRFSSRW